MASVERRGRHLEGWSVSWKDSASVGGIQPAPCSCRCSASWGRPGTCSGTGTAYLPTALPTVAPYGVPAIEQLPVPCGCRCSASWAPAPARPRRPAHTHALSLSHTHSLTHSLSLSHTHSLTHSLSHTHTHSLSFSHTHTQTNKHTRNICPHGVVDLTLE